MPSSPDAYLIQLPLWAAHSTSQRNTFVELISWGLILQSFSRALI